MKTNITISFLSIMLLSIGAKAQTEFTLTASELEPHADGWYIGGITYDFFGNGQPVHGDGCPEDDIDPETYERRNNPSMYDAHNESGTQQGFTYKNAMILPDCDTKYEDDLPEEKIDPNVSHGFIQLRPQVDTADLDLKESYILSPLVSNLQSVTIETSVDISIQPDRRLIAYDVEISLDSGQTWEFNTYIPDEVDVRSGYRATYDSEDVVFQDMMDFSTTQNVMLRFISYLDNPDLGAYKGQYVNVHKITVVADSAKVFDNGGGGGGMLSVSEERFSNSSVLVNNQTISTRGVGQLSVYSFSGKLLARGTSVTMSPGLYIVVTDQQERRKVLISK